MHLQTRGLVLKVSYFNEHDALISLLTPEHGRITVKARGLRRKKSTLSAPCQLLALADYSLFEYKGKYTINDASVVELFSELRDDISKLSLGTYFAQVTELISQEDRPNQEVLSLLLNCLYAISKLSIPEIKVKIAFELRCACLAGYMPDLSGCYSCGSETPDRFDVSGGVLECKECRNLDSDGLRMPVTPGILDAMRYIISCAPKAILRFDLGEDSLSKLSQITETYLITQLERGFTSLDFYKSLQYPL